MEDDRFVDSVRSWVNNCSYTHPKLERDEFDALNSFALLWSVFEGYVCDKVNIPQGQSFRLEKIDDFVEKSWGQRVSPNWHDDTRITAAFEYFKVRYTNEETGGASFEKLRFRTGHYEQCKKDFAFETLCKLDPSASDIVKSLLVIIYRLRNNLFHGVKWAQDDGMRDQQQNFEHASKVLMAVMDISAGRGHP